MADDIERRCLMQEYITAYRMVMGEPYTGAKFYFRPGDIETFDAITNDGIREMIQQVNKALVLRGRESGLIGRAAHDALNRSDLTGRQKWVFFRTRMTELDLEMLRGGRGNILSTD